MGKTKSNLSKWLRSGIIEKNIKNNLELTLNALYDDCPHEISRKSLHDSLHDVVCNDREFRQKCQAHTTIFGWFVDEKSSSSSPTSRKQSNKKTNFNKMRHSFTVRETHETNNNNTRNTRGTSPLVQETFSFNENEQGAIVEPFINLAEKAAYDFLVKNESIIPSKVVDKFVSRQQICVSKDFRNADLLCLLNFIIENVKMFSKKSLFHGQHKANPADLLTNFKKNVRHKLAHGIVSEKGRWCDHALQHVAILACEVIICLDGEYEVALSKKEYIENEIIRRWVSKRKFDQVGDEVISDENLNDDEENHKPYEADDGSRKKKRKTGGEGSTGIIAEMGGSRDRFYDLKERESQKRFELEEKKLTQQYELEKSKLKIERLRAENERVKLELEMLKFRKNNE